MKDFNWRPSEILGVKIDLISQVKAVEKIASWLQGNDKKYVVTPNPEIITYAQKDCRFKEILNQADLAIPDGAGVVWALKTQNSKLKTQSREELKPERVTGVDLMLKLCELTPRYGWKIGLIGGFGETAKKTAQMLQTKYPGINIVLAENGGQISQDGKSVRSGVILSEAKNLLSKRDPSARLGGPQDDKVGNLDLLFVAFGFPKQEYWIAKNLASFPAKVFIPVGGAFDYLSGKVKRAPVWLQKIGLEWLYRLIKEPWRLKRQIKGAEFFWLVFKEKFK